MSSLYELAILGSPSNDQIRELESILTASLHQFGLRLGHDVSWQVCPTEFKPDQKKSAAAAFYGGVGSPEANLSELLRKAVAVIPVGSDPSKVHDEIPDPLKPLNCLFYNQGGARRVASALLECSGLLPRQRRVFLSYRRKEARQAALQLFDEFSSRVFDVFLDTHGIAPADDFQSVLWHRLCDSDVLVMLDTSTYFESRWTAAEFGRAQSKGISILRIGWPGVKPSPRTATVSNIELSTGDVDSVTGSLVDEAIKRICSELEAARSKSHAVRNLNMVSKLRNAVETIDGQLTGVGLNKAVYLHLPDGRQVVVYPTIGVPTSTALHEASIQDHSNTVAVLYDTVGLLPGYLGHLDWLGSHVHSVRWLKAHEAAWALADWRP